MSTSEKHDRQVLFIHQGKGQRDRYVPIGMRALLWIARYVELSRPLRNRKNSFHAVGCYGMRLVKGFNGLNEGH